MVPSACDDLPPKNIQANTRGTRKGPAVTTQCVLFIEYNCRDFLFTETAFDLTSQLLSSSKVNSEDQFNCMLFSSMINTSKADDHCIVLGPLHLSSQVHQVTFPDVFFLMMLANSN